MSSKSSSKQSPTANSNTGALAAGAAQSQGGKNNIVNTGTLNQIKDNSKKTITTNIGNSTVTVKGSGSINYNTMTNGLTGNDLVAFENQIAGSLNSGNSGGGGVGPDIAVGNPSPTVTQTDAATKTTLAKYGLIALAVLFPALFGIYWLVKGRKKSKK
jgi:hypothetical protein